MKKRQKRISSQIDRLEKTLAEIPRRVEADFATVKLQAETDTRVCKEQLHELYDELRETMRHSQAFQTLKELLG